MDVIIIGNYTFTCFSLYKCSIGQRGENITQVVILHCLTYIYIDIKIAIYCSILYLFKLGAQIIQTPRQSPPRPIQYIIMHDISY